MNLNFDLNLLPLDDDTESLFDLNQTPTNDEGFTSEDDGFPLDNNPTDIDPEMDQVELPHGSKKTLSNKERWTIYNALLKRSKNGRLDKSTTREVSALLSVPIQQVQRIWRRAKETSSNGGDVDVAHRKTGNCGRKTIPLDLNQVTLTPLHKRMNLRTFAAAMNVSHSTLHRRVKNGTLRRHSNAIKPSLTDDNMKSRLRFCLSMLEKSTLVHEPKFVNMYNIVHIDEKWFYMTRKNQTYYLLPDEKDPYRTCQSKNYIAKVMFLAAMARPRFDEEGNETFSGKIGVFPFVTTQPAQRRSKHRDAGTLEMKASTSVKRNDIRAILIEKVIPIIHEKWPIEDREKTIYIQQDNARTHVECGDKEFQEAACKNGFDICLMCQPPNSPDLNILDLGFFNAIQSLQHQTCPKTVEDLVHAVEKSFDEYPTTKVNYIFLTLQSCMKEIMEIGGSNNYKMPHMNKPALDREGLLPLQITCDSSLVESVKNTLASVG